MLSKVFLHFHWDRVDFFFPPQQKFINQSEVILQANKEQVMI